MLEKKVIQIKNLHLHILVQCCKIYCKLALFSSMTVCYLDFYNFETVYTKESNYEALDYILWWCCSRVYKNDKSNYLFLGSSSLSPPHIPTCPRCTWDTTFARCYDNGPSACHPHVSPMCRWVDPGRNSPTLLSKYNIINIV